MNDPLSPSQIKELTDTALSVITKMSRARANQKQAEAAAWQRTAKWCEREQDRRKRSQR